VSKKKFISIEDFALPAQAIDLVKESIRGGIEFDAFGDRQVFTAIALTTSVPLTKVEATGYGAAFSGLNLGTGMRHKFKARILDEDSPHLFLPDPCALAKNGNKNATMSAIQRHTDFIQINVKGNKVSAGDIVEVVMRKNIFSYDLQVGLFNKILAFNAEAADLLRDSGCDTLAADFDYKRIPAKTESVDTSDIGIGKKFQRQIRNRTDGPTRVGAGGHGYTVALVEALRVMEADPGRLIPAGGYIRKLTINDNERDGWAFARIIYDKVADYSWEHVFDLYKGKNAKYILKKLKAEHARVNAIPGEENLGVWAAIFDEQFKKEVFLSWHQTGLAIDYGTTMYTGEQIKFLAAAALSLGTVPRGAAYSTRKILGEPIGGYFKYSTTPAIERADPNVIAPDEHLHIAFNLPTGNV
jgi:hypothetical protein